MLLLAAFGVQGHKVDVHVGLRNTFNPYTEVTGNLIRRFDIAFHTHLRHGQFLPAQPAGGDIRQQLRSVDGTAHLDQPFCRTTESRQRVVQSRRVDDRIQIEIFYAQLAFHIGAVWSQFQMQARNGPLQIAVAFQRSVDVNLVLLNVPGQFQLRHVHLPGAAIQAAPGFDQAIELRRPVGDLFRGVDAVQRQLASPADRLLPVHQRFQLGFPFQRRHAEFIEINLLFVAFRIKGNGRWRNILPFHRRTHRQRVVRHLAGELELDIVGLELFVTGKRPVNLLTDHLQIQRQAGFRQTRLGTQIHVHRPGKVNTHFQLFAQRAAHLQFDLLALQRIDVQRAVQGDVYRPVIGQLGRTAGIHCTLTGVDIERIELHVAVDAAYFQQQVIHRQVSIAGDTQLFAFKRFNIEIERQMHVRHLRQNRLRKQIFQRSTKRFFIRLRVLDLRLDHLFLSHLRHFRQRDQQSL